MREVAILGVGMTRFRPTQKRNAELFAEAAVEAILASNLRTSDIDAVYLGNALGGLTEGHVNMAPAVADELGIPGNVPATRFENACATSSVAIIHAAMAVAAGFHDIVLAGGCEKVTSLDTSDATRVFAMGTDPAYEQPSGITFPGIFALAAHLYAHKYEIPLPVLKEHMALISVQNHKNGAVNPLAHFFEKPVTLEKVKDSFMVADPLQLFDCCPFTDGGSAIVITTAEKARKLVPDPVYIAGMAQAYNGPIYTQNGFPRAVAREVSARKAYKQAGIGPQDIQVCELHDCFTIAEIIAIEGLGFYEFGKGSMAVEKGELDIGGKIPINPSGGLKAKGHPVGATGSGQVYEIVNQLRGECGDRQIDGPPKIGMTDTMGGDFASVCNIVLRRN